MMLVDDHTIMLECLSTKLEKGDNFEVIARAKDGRTAVKLALELNPDIIIMDISLPDLNGIDATHQILKLAPHIKVLGLSMHSDKSHVIDMIKAGASGYILKDCSYKELLFAIDILNKDQFYITPQITGIIIKDLISCGARTTEISHEELSQKEREVLQLIAEGHSSKEIASDLNITIRTVDAHRMNIKKKLDIHTTAGLVKYAIRANLTFL